MMTSARRLSGSPNQHRLIFVSHVVRQEARKTSTVGTKPYVMALNAIATTKFSFKQGSGYNFGQLIKTAKCEKSVSMQDNLQNN